jgi:hypothetical protein
MSNPLRAALIRALGDPAALSATTGRKLRPYQAECARAIARSVLRGEGKTFTVMLARQMGKNETSAQLEAYLLTRFSRCGGTIVKAAPSFKPQLITSMLRLKETLSSSALTRFSWRSRFGYMTELGRAGITFLSADPGASVVGATASLLLEIDEAQDVEPDIYDRCFRPMASSTAATTVLYGTAWSEDSVLQRQIERNRAIERHTGEQLNFRFDWTALAAINPAYRRYVETEIERLGENHPTIQTQYLLRCLSDAGRLFSAEQRAKLQGTHFRERQPEPGATYVAGVDLAGEDEEAEDAAARRLAPRRDSTVVTIARAGRDANGNVTATVVDHVWWTGRDAARQFEDLVRLCEGWNFARICVDASGIGAVTASFLSKRFPGRVEQFVFSAPSKSRLAFDMLALINTDRLSIYGDEASEELRQLRKEVAVCRYWLRANEVVAWGVPPAEGHDDFIASLALCCRASLGGAVTAESGLVRAVPPADHRDRW